MKLRKPVELKPAARPESGFQLRRGACGPDVGRVHRDRLSRRHVDLMWVCGGLLLVLLGTLIGAQIIPIGPLVSGELRINYWFAAHRLPVVSGVAIAVHYLLGPFMAPLTVAAVCLTALLRRAYRFAAVVIWVPAVGWGFAKLAKALWGRPRPPVVELNALVHETSASFPSGHTAYAAAVVATVIALLAIYRCHVPWWGLVLGVLFVAFVGVTRMYVGAHYLADVLSAPLYCWGAVAVTVPLLRKIRMRPQSPDQLGSDRSHH